VFGEVLGLDHECASTGSGENEKFPSVFKAGDCDGRAAVIQQEIILV
jgi:hypothetical protein